MASPSVTSNAMSMFLGSACLRRPSADGSVAAHCAADFLHHADGGEGGRMAVKEGEGAFQGTAGVAPRRARVVGTRVSWGRVSRPEGLA